LGLEFLHAQDVGILFAESFEQAFFPGGADAVQVKGDYSHVSKFHFFGDTALASSRTPSHAVCTVFVVCSSPPCLAFELKFEIMSRRAL
jgi:hypothetical protein